MYVYVIYIEFCICDENVLEFVFRIIGFFFLWLNLGNLRLLILKMFVVWFFKFYNKGIMVYKWGVFVILYDR